MKLPYHKIQTVYLRDPDNNYKTLLDGQFTRPEFEYLARSLWVFTEKVDGTNIRVIWDCVNTLFAGKTDRAQIPPFLLNKLDEMFPASKFAELYPETSMTLYGEGYGAKIQKGGGNYIPDGVSFILFDVKINGLWLERENVEAIGVNLGIDTVPVVGTGELLDAVHLAKDGFGSFIGTQMAEGIVMRPAVELQDRTGQRIITKIKNKDFPL
jgi:ATP-dependent RNA circularization protein (DNA/RNA ligase family)